MTDQDLTQELQQRVQAAAAAGTPLCIRGGDTKRFYGREPLGEPLDVAGHRGILSYEPSELVITARAGTPLDEIEQALAEQGQILPFEPPHFGPGSTIGGAVASGLAGPRRPWGGAPRDLLLGVKLLDGKGQILKFGGQVMKNVAGYDLSRLMAGAMGCLGVLLEVSLKVLPSARPGAQPGPGAGGRACPGADAPPVRGAPTRHRCLPPGWPAGAASGGQRCPVRRDPKAPRRRAAGGRGKVLATSA